MAIQARHKNLAFYGIPSSTGTVKYVRMEKFTQFSQSKNPMEYSRQYVDKPFQQTDVVGFSPSIDYAFDKHSDLEVHKDIIQVTNHECIGEDAVRTIILVDTDTGDAIKREYAVIPNTEGDNINIYTHSGSFKCKGKAVFGQASSEDDWKTCTFTETEDT